MPKITFNNTEFDAAPLKIVDYKSVEYDGYFDNTIYRITKTRQMNWRCDGHIRDPDPFPKVFKAVEPHLLIYHNANFWPKNSALTARERQRIDLDSARAGSAFMKALGFADVAALNAELKKVFGASDVPLDVDNAISNLKLRYRLKIKVKLWFRNFELKNPKIIPHAKIIVSLPDLVAYEAKKTHECTEEGVIRITKKYNYFHWLTGEPVRAKTKEAFALRRISRDDKIAFEEGMIERAKTKQKEILEELEKMKPEGD